MAATKNLSFEDVAVGDEHSFVNPRITRTSIVRYAGASGDFNPVHHDELVAIRAGYDRVFAMGALSGGFLAHLASDWFGLANLRTLSYQFRGQVWPGDVLTSKGAITRKYDADGEHRVDADLRVENHRGESVTVGSVTAALPSHG